MISAPASMKLIPILWGWQRQKNGKRSIRQSARPFSSRTDFCPSVGNADTGQGDPSWRITRRKGLNQALNDVIFIGGRDQINFLQRPDIRPTFVASMVRWLGHHRESSLGGRSDRRRVGSLLLPRPKFDGEYDQRDTKCKGVCSQPPGAHNSSDERCNDKERALGKRQHPAQNQPPAAVVYGQPEARS